MHIFRCMGSKFCVKFQRAPLKFHTKFWTHTPTNMHFTVFNICVWVVISLNCDVISLSETAPDWSPDYAAMQQTLAHGNSRIARIGCVPGYFYVISTFNTKAYKYSNSIHELSLNGRVTWQHPPKWHAPFYIHPSLFIERIAHHGDINK